MADFDARIYSVIMEPHPDADRLEIARVGGYACVVAKGQFRTGDLAAHIPEQAVVPDDVIDELGLAGMLAGSRHNRVKARRFRGVFSQGLLYPVAGRRLGERNIHAPEGSDVAELLGITRYEPPIPPHFRGKVERMPGLVRYDVENLKKYPGAFRDGEPVIMTEKLHGTLCRMTCRDGTVSVSSKGMGNRGLAFSPDGNTVYHRACRMYADDIGAIGERLGSSEYTVFGEIFGKGIQDLAYGSDLDMRVFDIYSGGFLPTSRVCSLLGGLKLKYVPVVWGGPYSAEAVEMHTSGSTMVPGGTHLREGVVIRPVNERDSVDLDRVILKSVAQDYILRKGGTEYN